MRYLLLLFIVCLFSVSARADEPFHNLGFDAARETAKKDGKIIVIDFYAVWCGPCKMLDKATWRDEKVQAWLKEKAIALKIDAEKEIELANRYNVRAYPTILIIKADGSEIDRLVGFRDAEQFLAEAGDALIGKDSVARAKDLLTEENKNDPMLRMRYADALAQKGRIEEALNEYLWCFDNGANNSSFVGVRLSFLLRNIKNLGRSYPAAIDALKLRRDNAEQLVFNGKADRIKVIDLVKLNELLGEKNRTLETFDKLKYSAADRPELRGELVEHVILQLLNAHRYTDIVESLKDITAKVEQSLARFDETAKFFSSQGNLEGKDKIISQIKSQTINNSCNYYEALLGVKNKDQAGKVAERLIKFDSTGNTFVSLIDCALRVGDNDTALELAQLGLKTLPEDEKPAVLGATSKIPGWK